MKYMNDTNRFGLFHINDSYLNQLESSLVPFNKEERRPYLGPVFSPYDGISYFVPMQTPNKADLDRDERFDAIIKCEDEDSKLVGVLKFNHMIPVSTPAALLEINAEIDSESRTMQYNYFNSEGMRERIIKMALKTYNGYFDSMLRGLSREKKDLEQNVFENTNLSVLKENPTIEAWYKEACKPLEKDRLVEIMRIIKRVEEINANIPDLVSQLRRGYIKEIEVQGKVRDETEAWLETIGADENDHNGNKRYRNNIINKRRKALENLDRDGHRFYGNIFAKYKEPCSEISRLLEEENGINKLSAKNIMDIFNMQHDVMVVETIITNHEDMIRHKNNIYSQKRFLKKRTVPDVNKKENRNKDSENYAGKMNVVEQINDNNRLFPTQYSKEEKATDGQISCLPAHCKWGLKYKQMKMNGLGQNV